MGNYTVKEELQAQIELNSVKNFGMIEPSLSIIS